MKKHICENDYDSSESTGQCLPQSLVSIWASVEMEAMGWRGPNQNGVSRFNSDMVVLGQCRLRARLAVFYALIRLCYNWIKKAGGL